MVPGGTSTAKAVNAEVLKALGPNGVFINIGRGSTVDEVRWLRQLRDGTILAAGLDVFADEPNVPKALLDLPNASLLPHVGSASVHTRNAMADLVVDNLESWFSKDESASPPSPGDGACSAAKRQVTSRRSGAASVPARGRARPRRRRRGISLPSC